MRNRRSAHKAGTPRRGAACCARAAAPLAFGESRAAHGDCYLDLAKRFGTSRAAHGDGYPVLAKRFGTAHAAITKSGHLSPNAPIPTGTATRFWPSGSGHPAQLPPNPGICPLVAGLGPATLGGADVTPIHRTALENIV